MELAHVAIWRSMAWELGRRTWLFVLEFDLFWWIWCAVVACSWIMPLLLEPHSRPPVERKRDHCSGWLMSSRMYTWKYFNLPWQIWLKSHYIFHRVHRECQLLFCIGNFGILLNAIRPPPIGPMLRQDGHFHRSIHKS